MSSTILTFRDATLEVLQAVLTESSKQREHAMTNLANGEQWAPQVSCAGSHEGRMLYRIVTAPFTLIGAGAIMLAAQQAVYVVPQTQV
jgi:hypothetical protein